MPDHDEAPQRWTVTTRAPTPHEYAHLCQSVGWEAYADEERAAVAIDNSLAYATAVMDGTAIGMGRVVGDRAVFFYLQDIAVDPHHQRQGIGAAIVSSLMQQVRTIAPPGSFIGLFAAPGAAPLYVDAGFENSTGGMSQYLPW